MHLWNMRAAGRGETNTALGLTWHTVALRTRATFTMGALADTALPAAKEARFAGAATRTATGAETIEAECISKRCG
jgi:hypothetical protein